MDTLQTNRIQQITQTLVEQIQPEKIVLFGSYASNRAALQSDIDLLVIVESNLRRDKRQEAISQILRPFKFPIDILAYNPSEVAICLETPGSFVGHILQTGQILYERQSA